VRRAVAEGRRPQVGTDVGAVVYGNATEEKRHAGESAIIAWRFGHCAKRTAGTPSNHGFSSIYALCEALCEALCKRELLTLKHHLIHARSGVGFTAKALRAGFAGPRRLGVQPR
jgi:hypothetical protein